MSNMHIGVIVGASADVTKARGAVTFSISRVTPLWILAGHPIDYR
jgi:hypothetical protein